MGCQIHTSLIMYYSMDEQTGYKKDYDSIPETKNFVTQDRNNTALILKNSF